MLETPDSKASVNALRQNGWTVLPNSAQRLVDIAHSLGRVVPARAGGPLVDGLRPTPSDRASPRSLSAIYGTGAFPFHIDTAHWGVPCRYILLCNERSTDAVPTVLLPWESCFTSEDLSLLTLSVFLVRNGRHSFYASAYSPTRRLLRYDPGCMSPASRDAQAASRLIGERTESAQAVAHQWTRGSVLIIDNWRVLHSRPDASNASARHLRRVLVTL